MRLISILTPVKNAAPWLDDCIASVLAQNYTQWEWIFVNDHSNDDTATLLAAWAKKDPRIQLHQNPGKGILPALQCALQHANGTYVSRMDADDLMPPHRLQHMLDAMEKAPLKCIITGKVRYFSTTSISAGYKNYENWLNQLSVQNTHWQNIYRECVVASPNWMMRITELRAIGGFGELEYPEDYDLCFRWYQFGFTIQTLPYTTLLWHEHPKRTSRNSTAYQQPAFFALKLKRFVALDYKPERPLVLLGTGKKARLSADVLLRAKLPFRWIGMRAAEAHVGAHNISIEPLIVLAQLHKPMVLLSIYPAKAEREKLETHLHYLNLHPAKDYWYL